ncbi:hypothetical protein Micbo1qcDRAFT_165378, partial [Microdochium bolleyi]
MCPPGVDQTTRRPPRWTIMALEAEQVQKLPDYNSPWNFIAARKTLDAWRRLYRVSAQPGNSPLPAPEMISTEITTNKNDPAILGNALTANIPKVATIANTAKPCRSSASTKRLSRLESLPADLFSLTTSYLIEDAGGPSALAALALTSQHLFQHVLYHLHHRFISLTMSRAAAQSQSGIWAGQ